ncbi:putative DNA-binding protein with PD1-like motif [Pseudomonas corrugata]|uniref:PPC domain-containing DNA-binding protein n=1 Tax=Pseudomonas corrugata TaxID=47879 RepID=UPI00285509F1|nr:DNA-binding protein [Pseudomonas corrugata]MDR7284348.1 putative DNA-binding protein with PD1-like motif [Pseudomonas corrugata]
MHVQLHPKHCLSKLMLAVTTVVMLNSAAIAETQPTVTTTPMQCATEATPRYTKTATGYLMVLRMGDNAFKELTKLATAEKIPSASISGIGFGNVKFGFWNKDKKEFDARTFNSVEMASLTGSVAWKNDQPSIHMHGVAGDATFQAYGGHILDFEVTTGSMEITVIVHPRRLERGIDPCIGANVLGI